MGGEREREIEREREREREREMVGWMDGWNRERERERGVDGWMDRLMDGAMNGYRLKDEWMDRYIWKDR